MDLLTDFKLNVRQLIGQPCCFVFAGPSTGSQIDIHFGTLVPRRLPLQNPTLPSEARKFEGSFSLFVQCAWRLDSPSEVACGAWENLSIGSPSLQRLENLVGTVVTEIVEGVTPGLDLTLRFSNSDVLRIFCDHTDQREDVDNYSLFLPARVFTVGCRSVLRSERRD